MLENREDNNLQQKLREKWRQMQEKPCHIDVDCSSILLGFKTGTEAETKVKHDSEKRDILQEYKDYMNHQLENPRTIKINVTSHPVTEKAEV